MMPYLQYDLCKDFLEKAGGSGWEIGPNAVTINGYALAQFAAKKPNLNSLFEQYCCPSGTHQCCLNYPIISTEGYQKPAGKVLMAWAGRHPGNKRPVEDPKRYGAWRAVQESFVRSGVEVITCNVATAGTDKNTNFGIWVRDAALILGLE
jgi:hypothetical protein